MPLQRILSGFLHKLTFIQQLGALITFGVLLLALSSSLVGSWQSNERVRHDLLEQGKHITESMAAQSALALVYASSDNAIEAANTTLAFPGVVLVSIHDVNEHVLLTRGKLDPSEFPTLVAPAQLEPDIAILEAENKHAWRFLAPVFTRPSEASPFDMEPAKPVLLGHVAVVMSKAALYEATRDIFISNIAISLSFAVLFLFLIRFLTNRLTQPLHQLSLNMERAKEGASNVRAELRGPKDIADMALAFNDMMEVLEEREGALRIAAIAFEIEEGMIVTDRQGIIVRVNRVFSELTGYSAKEAIGKHLSELKKDQKSLGFYPRMQDILHRENYWQGEIWNCRKDGDIYPEWLTITAVEGVDKQITNYIAAFFDITERKQAEEKIHNLAFYDPLTQLPNRRLLSDRLEQSVVNSARNQTTAALAFIDLDHFKVLNDTRGHDVGDMLLVEVSKRLKVCIRDSDLLARLGGDEFVVLLEGLSGDPTQAAVQARSVGEKLIRVVNQPYSLENIVHHTTASIGISMFANYHKKIDDLLKHGDVRSEKIWPQYPTLF